MTRGVLGVVVVSAAMAAACDRLLQLSTVSTPVPADTSHMVDALPDGSSSQICSSDDFTGASGLNWSTFNGTAGATVTRTGGQLVIDVPMAVSTDNYAGISLGSQSLVGMTTSVLAVQVADLAGITTEFEWGVDQGSSDYIMVEEAMVLSVVSHVNGAVGRTVCGQSYDPTRPQYWRIRHDPSANQIYFEISDDAASWTSLCHEPPVIPLTDIDVYIQCGEYNTPAGGAKCVWDNFVMSGPC